MSNIASKAVKLVEVVQLGNHLSDKYEADKTTNAFTVGGVCVPAAVGVGLEALGYFKPEYAMSGTLIATVSAIVASVASQVVPWTAHLLKIWNEKRKADAKARVDTSVDTTGWAKTPVSGPCPDPLGPITPACEVKRWTVDGKLWHYATSRVFTLGKLINERPDATSAELVDGRVWVKS